MSNIQITITSLSTNRTDSIEISSSMTLQDLSEYCIALLDLQEVNNNNNLVLTKNGQRLFEYNGNATSSSSSNKSLESVGIQNGDLIVVVVVPLVVNPSTTTATSAPTTTSTGRINANNSNSGGLALDFTSLLSSTRNNQATTTATGGNNTNLHFNIPQLAGQSLFLFGNNNNNNNNTPIQWDGMSLDDAIERNPNPDCFVKVLLNEQRHGNLMKELNYHMPMLAKKIKNANGLQDAANIWRQYIQQTTIKSTMSQTTQLQKENDMKKRLQLNPMDEEANAYFGEKIRKQNVREQYYQMMEEFPESLGRVLMLYIDAKVNDYPIQAFVDSGAQMTIMSSKCAEKCGILHLLDDNFAGMAVGVGTGKILGRIHIAQVQIANHFFPCTITIMDSEEGLGDKNMDFLLGLDMLKRHRCNIDLAKNALVFRVGDNTFETKFLHEKDLDETKGGTKGFDVKKNNEEIEKMQEDRDSNK